MRIQIEQPRQAIERHLLLGLGFQKALLLVLKLHVGAQSVNPRTHPVFLQVIGLVVERLRQIHARLGRFHRRIGAHPRQVLRNHQQHNLLAHRGFLRLAGVHSLVSRLQTPP